MNKINRIIINADDFGMSESVNKAIVQSFRDNLIDSTSILVNMPGFLDAVNRVQNDTSLQGKLGLHVNLTEGYSLTEDIRKQKRFCNASGLFTYNRRQRLFSLSKAEQTAVYHEIKAQLDKALNFNIVPSHIDSHHHVHTEWGISKIVIRVIREYEILKMRMARNMGIENAYSKMIYKSILNFYLKRKGFTHTDFFGDIEDLNHTLKKKRFTGKLIELMVHPMLNDKGELVDSDQNYLHLKIYAIREKFSFVHL